MVESRSPVPLHTKADAPTSMDRCLTSASFIAENTTTRRVWVVLLDLTAYLQSVDVGQVEVDHHHVRLESLRGVQHGAAVCDVSHDVAVQRQQAADGFRHSRVVFGEEHAGSLGQIVTFNVRRHSAGPTGSRPFGRGAG